MQRIRRFAKPLLLAAAMICPVIATGCAARVQYYDTYYRDYHRWTPAKAVPTRNIGTSAASHTASGRTSTSASSASIGSGVTLTRGATKAGLNAGKW